MTKQIPLTQGKFALVDDEDYEELSRYKWHADKGYSTWYAMRNVGIFPHRRRIRMHRQILGADDRQMFVDHRNGNGLDNRRANLRLATCAENNCNTHERKDNKVGFKGVCFHKASRSYVAQIQINGEKIHLGCFPTPETAARAYDEAAKKYHGDFAKTNL